MGISAVIKLCHWEEGRRRDEVGSFRPSSSWSSLMHERMRHDHGGRCQSSIHELLIVIARDSESSRNNG